MAQKIIDVDAQKTIACTVAELQLPARALIFVLGEFEGKFDEQVRSICSRVIVPAALDSGALILDDAGRTGCAHLIEQAALEQDRMVTLVGVVPSTRADAEINSDVKSGINTDNDSEHAVILRLPAEWTDALKYTFQIADGLRQAGTNSVKPAVAVLFGGGEAEKKALVRCARRGWPVLVITGTGGIADQVGNQIVNSASAIDPELAEIVETAKIFPYPIKTSADELSRILLDQIAEQQTTAGGTLEQVWQRFDELDLTAVAKQARFRSLERMLLMLAVLGALFAILTTSSAVPEWLRVWAHRHGLPTGSLHLLVILTPIALTAMAGYNSYFRDGTKWILLRGAAEALKREIFRFRARAGEYSEEQCLKTSRELKLAGKMKDITGALGQSEANQSNMRSLSVGKGREERTTFLSPDEYVEARLRDQVRHYAGQTRRLARQQRWLQSLIYAAGAAGTLLAAIRLDVWVALATASVTALTTKLQTDQVENALTQYNQGLGNLRNIDAWWNALSKWEKSRRQNIDLLVEETEGTLESESARWVQQMQTGLNKLTEKDGPR